LFVNLLKSRLVCLQNQAIALVCLESLSIKIQVFFEKISKCFGGKCEKISNDFLGINNSFYNSFEIF
jgi:hypothetical protein